MRVNLYSRPGEHDLSLIPFARDAEVAHDSLDDLGSHLTNGSWLEIKTNDNKTLRFRCEDVRGFEIADDS